VCGETEERGTWGGEWALMLRRPAFTVGGKKWGKEELEARSERVAGSGGGGEGEACSLY